jgi:hypothetical protein
MTNVMHKFFIYFVYLFTSALRVSGFLLAYLQRQAQNLGSGSSLLGMVSAPGRRTMTHYFGACILLRHSTLLPVLDSIT